MLNQLNNKEKRKLKHKTEKTQKRLSKIENEKKLFGNNYDYLKKKSVVYKRLYVNKYFTTKTIYKEYKTDKDFGYFLFDIELLFIKGHHKSLNQDELQELKNIIEFVFDNYNLTLTTILNKNYSNSNVFGHNIFYNNIINKEIGYYEALFSGLLCLLYGNNKKGNLYYNICLDFFNSFYLGLKNELNNTKNLSYKDEILEFMEFMDYRNNIYIEEKPGFKEGRFLDYLKPL